MKVTIFKTQETVHAFKHVSKTHLYRMFYLFLHML